MTEIYTPFSYCLMMISQMFSFYGSLLSQGFFHSVIIFIVGVIFALELSKLTVKIFKDAGVDKFADKAGLKSFLKKGGFNISLSGTAGWIVKWFILLFFLTIAVESLNFPQVSNFLFDILGYIPNLIGAMAILTIGTILAQMIYEAVEGASQATGMHVYHLAAVIVKVAIMVLTLLVVLEQVGIQTTVLQIFAGGLSLMVALAGGLAFGLGGQYYARELLDEMKGKLKK